MHSLTSQFPAAAFAAPAVLTGTSCGRRATCGRRAAQAAAAPERTRLTVKAPAGSQPAASLGSPRAPAQPIVDGPYARACISLLRHLLRSRTGNTSARPGYAGLVDECRLLLARRGPEEQRAIVEALLDAAVFSPVGVKMFRKFFAHRPAFNADLTPLAFSWLVGKSERNKPPEGGEGVYIEKCRFLEEAACKGLCVNMCQQPVQNLFTKTLGLPLRMTPNYDDNSCQMTFGVPPLPVDEDPAASGDCLVNCKMSQAFRRTHSAAKCYIESD